MVLVEEKANTNLGSLLLEAAQPNIYSINAFRILELPVDCGEQDQSKRQKMIDIAKKNDQPPPAGPGRALPLDETPDFYTIHNALERLRDPERRFIDEFFWFWPHELGDGRGDEALAVLRERDLEGAVEIWTDYANTYSEENVSVHNLAILSHTLALDLENKSITVPLSEAQLKKLEIYWKQTYKRWKMLLSHEGFWSRLVARVKDFGDPRLDSSTVDEMRRMLPLGLLSINAHLAVLASEKNDQAAVDRQLQIMKTSGMENGHMDDAILRALEPSRERIKTFCKNAKSQADADPVHAILPSRNLLEQCQPLLEVIDRLLAKDTPSRQTIHDEVALRGLDCTIAYGNKTENWKDAKKLLEAYHKIAESPGIRRRLEENINTLKGNLESGNQWCGDGYYDLPEPILESLEKARQLNNNQEYGQAITILEGLLSQTTPALTEGQKNLVRKPLSTCLNMRANIRFTAAMQELDKPRKIIEKIQENVRNNSSTVLLTMFAVSSGSEQQMARSGSLVCMACLRTVTTWYTFAFNETKLLICESCNQKHNQEMEGRKNVFKKALLEVNNDLLRAIELDPTSPNPKNNLEELKKIASQLSISLPGKSSAAPRESKPAQVAPKPAVKPSAPSKPAVKPAPRAPVLPTSQTSFWPTVWIMGLIALGLNFILKPILASPSFSGSILVVLTGMYFSLPAILVYVLTKRPGAAFLLNILMYFTFNIGGYDVKNFLYILASSTLYYVCFRGIANKKVTFINLFGISLITFGLEVLLSLFFWQWQPDFLTLIYNVEGSLVAVILTLILGKMFKRI